MKKPNYKGFVKHLQDWDKNNIPYGKSDLIKLSKIYHTPIPKTL